MVVALAMVGQTAEITDVKLLSYEWFHVVSECF